MHMLLARCAAPGLRHGLGMMLVLAMLLMPAGAFADKKLPKPPKLDKDARKEVQWIEKAIDLNAGFQIFLAGAVQQTTSTEMTELYTELQTTLTQQKAILDGYLWGWYKRTYIPKPRILGPNPNDPDDDDEECHEVGWTRDMLNLNRVIQYGHVTIAHMQSAKKLKHKETRRFAAQRIVEYKFIVALCKEWIRVLEEMMEDDAWIPEDDD